MTLDQLDVLTVFAEMFVLLTMVVLLINLYNALMVIVAKLLEIVPENLDVL